MQDGTKVYKQKNITFIVTPDRIIVRTSLPQTFFLQARQHYWTRRIQLVEIMLELGEIRSLQELASYTRPGVDWIPTRYNYKLENVEDVRYNH